MLRGVRMFDAFSVTKNLIVNVKNEYNLNEVFECPNPNCGAKFKIKSANGKKAKHFARLQSTPHTIGCPYKLKSEMNLQDENLVKMPISDIYMDTKLPNEKKAKARKGYILKSNEVSPKFVRTPLQLLSLCINSNLEEHYSENLKIGDIILDNRNLLVDANFEGICGLRLVLAETVRFEKPNTLYLKLWTKTRNNKTPTLYITVLMQQHILEKLINHVLKTHGTFGGHSVAVFEEWSIEKPYNIICEIKNEKHILYKF